MMGSIVSYNVSKVGIFRFKDVEHNSIIVFNILIVLVLLLLLYFLLFSLVDTVVDLLPLFNIMLNDTLLALSYWTKRLLSYTRNDQMTK